jgi:hypothetical protein
MTVNYTTLLALGQPVTGTESGTWGDDVNNAVTSYLDIAIAGTLTLTGDGAVTLANTQGTSTATNISSTTAQYYIIKVVGPLTATKVITAPSTSKTYIVNNTDSTYGVTVKASGQTGVTVAAGQRALVVFNGTDYVQVGASAGGSNTQVQYNSSGALAGSANLTFNGTTLSANTLSLTNALTVPNGGSGLATATAYALLTGGTTSTGAFQQVSGTGTSGQLLTSNGAGALPTWQNAPTSGVTQARATMISFIFGF